MKNEIELCSLKDGERERESKEMGVESEAYPFRYDEQLLLYFHFQ